MTDTDTDIADERKKGVAVGEHGAENPPRPSKCTVSDACHRRPTLLVSYVIVHHKRYQLKRWACPACLAAIREGRGVSESLEEVYDVEDG